MDVDKDRDDDDDEGDRGTGETPEEDVVQEGTLEEDEPIPEPKGKTKAAKGKASHPSFMFTAPASGISGCPTSENPYFNNLPTTP